VCASVEEEGEVGLELRLNSKMLLLRKSLWMRHRRVVRARQQSQYGYATAGDSLFCRKLH